MVNYITITRANLIIKDYVTCLLMLQTHSDNSTLKVAVGSMNSIETQIPFSYYYLNISMPENLIELDEGLSEIFTGDRTYLTNYEVIDNNIRLI